MRIIHPLYLLMLLGGSLLFTVIPATLHAQSGIVASGLSVSNSSGSVSFSVGQIDYRYFQSTAGSVNPGIQQPFEFFQITAVDESNFIVDAGISVYPNPASESITLGCKNCDDETQYELYDMNGKILSIGKIISAETIVSLEHYAVSFYFIRVCSAQQSAAIFKISKIQ